MSSHIIVYIAASEGKPHPTDPGITRHHIYYADNKRELAQEIIKARKAGHPIYSLHSQTKRGAKSIGAYETYQEVKIEGVKLPKLVLCPVCSGKGCTVCNQSGYTTPGYEKNWSEWQIEDMRKRKKSDKRS